MLSLLEQSYGETALDSFKVSDLMRWTPDAQYLKPLAKRQAGEVRKSFGMPVLSLAHYVNMWSQMSDAQQAAWCNASPVSLLADLSRLRGEMPLVEACWPSPQTIAESLLSTVL